MQDPQKGLDYREEEQEVNMVAVLPISPPRNLVSFQRDEAEVQIERHHHYGGINKNARWHKHHGE